MLHPPVGRLPHRPTPSMPLVPAQGTSLTFSEIKLYGDCVLRFVSGDYEVSCGLVQWGVAEWLQRGSWHGWMQCNA